MSTRVPPGRRCARDDAVPVEVRPPGRGWILRRRKQAELNRRPASLGAPFLGDALHVAHGEQTARWSSSSTTRTELVDADVLGEETVGAADGVVAQFALVDGSDLRAQGQRPRRPSLVA